MKTKKYTVITGASRGLGKCLAESCGSRGMNLILIALHNEGIHQLANSLTNQYGIDAIGYETDLTHDDELIKLSEWINRDYKIETLINNAGTGGTMPFQSVSGQYINNIVLLNIRALVMLTHSLLPNLKKQDKASILNIAGRTLATSNN